MLSRLATRSTRTGAARASTPPGRTRLRTSTKEKAMNKVFVTGVFLGIAALASPAYAQGDGNGGLSGGHYNLNILGKDNCAGDDLEGSNRHTIQVLLNFRDGTPTDPTSDPVLDKRNKIFLQEGDFRVIDGNACDNDGALFQLPANPFTCP